MAFLSGMIMIVTPWAGAQGLDETVVVSIEPATRSVVLGENLGATVTVTNTGPSASAPLVVHLDITDPAQSISVDPEDWTPTLSRSVGALEPGEATMVEWELQPISAGTFMAYAVVLSPDLDTISASEVLEIRVVDQRSLNPGGILPVAIAAPAIVGTLLLVQMRLARRG